METSPTPAPDATPDEAVIRATPDLASVSDAPVLLNLDDEVSLPQSDLGAVEAGAPEYHVAVIMCPSCGQSFPATDAPDGWIPAQSKSSGTCDECEGFGKVTTGSYIAEHAVKNCGKCGGTGYIEAGATTPAPLPTPVMVYDDRPPQPWANAVWDDAQRMWR